MESVKKDVSDFVWPGRVCQVIDPHYFWMQLGTKENLLQFEQLEKDMQVFAHQGWSPVTSIEELEPGMVVLVKSNPGNTTFLKRGQVACVMHGDSVDVFYVDYGNTEVKTIDKICINVPPNFKLCPPQAVRCSLAGVKPLVKSWTSRGIKTFQQLTANKLLSTLVLYGEPGYCEVALYQSDEGNGRSIGHSLVTEEVAMMMDEQMIPEFLHDIPNFMTQGYQGLSSSSGMNTPASTDDPVDGDKKISSTPPSAEKYIPPHQKVTGSSPGTSGPISTNHNTAPFQNSTGGQKYSNSSAKLNSYKSRSPGNNKVAKEPVNDFFPFDNVSVYPPSPSSPIKSPSKDYGFNGSSPRSRPKLNIPHSDVAQTPFYPPFPQVVDNVEQYSELKPWNLTAPHEVERTQPQYSLNSPAFYQTNIPPPPLNHSQHQHVSYYSQPSPTVSPIKQHANITKGTSSSKHQNDYNSRFSHQTGNSHYNDAYYKPEYRMGHETAQNNTRSTTNNNHGYFNHNNSNSHNNYNIQSDKRPSVKVQLPSPPSKFQGMDPLKLSPESPDSPAIAAFNLGDLEHTQMTSTDHFHQQDYHEKLQALHEEAEEIAKESREQSELVDYSRYAGLRGQYEESGDYLPAASDLDVLDQIAKDIHDTHSYKESEELKQSPLKMTWKSKEDNHATKFEEIPKSYIADINFADAVKEALESGKTNGMDNARALLDGIVESLKVTSVERHLYDVLLLMLAKAVKEYDFYHSLVMETINTLNVKMDIKESLGKAMRRQQELCVRVPTPRHPQHLNFSRVIAQIYNMAIEWSDSNAGIQDSILQTVEKWILFNNKGLQIGQVDKENVFLDCFEAFWDVSGTRLTQHNQVFRTRIADEVRSKLLHEAVQRSIRERLLDITLELFSINTEKRNVSTQTQRRTMIPSSCQVRPSTCDKATFMESEWQDEGFRNLDVDVLPHTNFSIDTDYASPDNVLSLRPLGRGRPLVKQSSPKDSFYSTKSNETSDSQSTHDLSKVSNISDSVYMTPGENRANNSSTDKSESSYLINGESEEEVTPKNTAKSARRNLMNSLKTDYEAEDSDDAVVDKTKDIEPWRDDQGKDENMKNDINGPVSAKKSAIGKSIVDWFDYDPPVAEKVGNGVKLETKRLQTKKKLDSTSMEIIENDVALKYAPTKDLGKKKSKKIKEKKCGKTNLEQDTRKQDSDPGIDSGAFENGLQQAIIESLQDTGDETVGTVDSVTKSADCIGDENIDWWAVGEGADPRFYEDGTQESIGDNIFIDNGPDVIIEDEFEQDVDASNNVINKGAEKNMESQEINKDHERFLNVESETDKCLSVSPGGEKGSVAEVVKHKHDNFAFEVDDDDNNDDEKWDSESSDDLNVNDWVGLQQDGTRYQQDCPETDLKTVVPVRKQEFVPSSSDTLCTENRYDSNFPKSNLAEFVNVSECDIEERPPRATRWVPGRRKCLNCYSEDHTTESCHTFVIMQ